MRNVSNTFYNIHNLVGVAVDESAANSLDHKNYLRSFETKNLEKIDYTSSKKYYESVLSPMQKILVTKNATFIHCLGAEVNGKGIIFPAAGGVGKTSLASYLRNIPGFRFFGDDFTIVKSDGTMLVFPSDFSIYPYHLPLFPELTGTKEEKFLKNFKYLAWFYFLRRAVNFISKRLGLGQILPGWNAPYVKVPAETFIPKEKIGKKITISAAVFLERYSGEEIKREEISLIEVIEKALNILKHELNLDDTDKERAILTSAFSRVKCYRIFLPIKLSNQEYFNYMREFLKSI